jgi:hypothetical protein
MTKEKTKEIIVPKMDINYLTVDIVGTSPLIIHQFSDKIKKQLLDKHKGGASKGRENKRPVVDLVECLYFLNGVKPMRLVEKMEKAGAEPEDDVTKYFKDTEIGFPATGFKKAAVHACRNLDDLPMTIARGSFFIKGEGPKELVKINYKKIIFGEDMVRLNGKVPDIRHRPKLIDWTAKLNIELNPRVLSAEQVCNLINISGFACGVGDWRPQKDGHYGMFTLKQ